MWQMTGLKKVVKYVQELEAGEEKGHLIGGLLEVALESLGMSFTNF